MDVILQALDTINDMFAQVQNREQPDAADPELLAELHRLSVPEGLKPEAALKPQLEPENPRLK